MDFVSSFDDQATQSEISYSTSKPMPIGPSRTFQQHQPSPVSPSLSKDLTEKIQSVRQVWEKAMPSVAEQSAVGEDSNFHTGFTDTFKTDSSRDFR